jgi:hypothetical protein
MLSDSPVFTTPIQLDYCFEQEQRLRFLVLDVDDPKALYEDNDFLGVLDTTLASIGE